mmetsp:Transcript_70169/g.169629  ORF Transcript_70169/g.169629 Transcript_70169/m.169629 type:complete len:332 (-) Transcript_70169:26-1021(-)
MVADGRPGGLEGLGVVVLPTEPLAVGDEVARLRVDILPEAAIHRRRPQTRVRPHARLGHLGVGVHAVRRKLGCGARGVERLSFTSTICAKVEVRRVEHRGRHNARDRTRAEVVGPAQRELWLPLRLHARMSKVLLVLGERVEFAAEGPLAGQRARRVERPEVPLDLRIRHAGRHALPHRRSSPEAVVHVGRRELGALRCAPAALRAGADELDLAEPQLVESDSALRYARAQCVLRPNREHRLVLRLSRVLGVRVLVHSVIRPLQYRWRVHRHLQAMQERHPPEFRPRKVRVRRPVVDMDDRLPLICHRRKLLVQSHRSSGVPTSCVSQRSA